MVATRVLSQIACLCAQWGDIYHSKQTIDWCTSYFPFFNDRIKCIKKLHPSGPLLG